MNWVDFVIIGVIAISVIVSVFRGFIREALSLLIWVLAVWLAYLFYKDVEPMLPAALDVPNSVRLGLAAAAIVLVVLIVGGLVTWLLGSILDKTGLSGTDRVVGMLFGGLRGVLLVVIAVMLAGVTPLPQDDWWKSAKLIPHFEGLAIWTKQKLPENIGQYIEFGTPAENPLSVELPKAEPAGEAPPESTSSTEIQLEDSEAETPTTTQPGT